MFKKAIGAIAALALIACACLAVTDRDTGFWLRQVAKTANSQVSFATSINPIFIQLNPATYYWDSGQGWFNNVTPTSSTNTVITFYTDTTAIVQGNITLIKDPPALTFTRLVVNGAGKTNDGPGALTIGTLGNQWTVGGTNRQIVLSMTNCGPAYGVTINPDVTFATIGTIGGAGTISNGSIFAGHVACTGTVTKSGVCMITFANSNNVNRITEASSGQINFNNNYSFPSNSFNTSIANAMIDNTSGVAVSNAWNSSNSIPLNAEFICTSDIDLGTNQFVFIAARTLTVDTGTLHVRGPVNGGGTLTKAGQGTLSLWGTTTLDTVNITSGTINFNSANAFPATLTMNASFGNSSGAAISNTAVTVWNLTGGTHNFIGPSSINLGSGAVNMSGTNKSISVNAASLELDGPISGTGTLSKNGAGILILGGSNTQISGGSSLNCNVGETDLNNSWATGPGTFSIGACVIGNSSGAVITNMWNPVISPGSFAFVGPYDYNMGTGSMASTVNRTFTISNATLTIGGPIGFANHTLTVQGNSALTLNGSNAIGGGIVLNGPTINSGNPWAIDTAYTHNYGYLANISGGAISNAGNPTLTWTNDFEYIGPSDYDWGTSDMNILESTGPGVVTISNSTFIIRGNIKSTSDGGYGFVKKGNGAFVTYKDTSFIGATTVSNGSWYVNGSNQHTTASYIVASGAKLAGVGRITVPITMRSGSILQGGDTNGAGMLRTTCTFSQTTTVVFNPFATNVVKIISTNSYSSINTTNATLNLNNAVLSVNDAGYSGTTGDVFLIWKIDQTTRQGTYTNLAENAYVTTASNTYAISYAGGDGNDITLTKVPPADITNGLIARYNMLEGSGTAIYDDVSTNSGVITGSQILWTNGPTAAIGGLFFPGNNSSAYACTLSNQTLSTLSTDWTMECWYKGKKMQVEACFVEMNSKGIMIAYPTVGGTPTNAIGVFNGALYSEKNATFTEDAWTHIVVTVSGTSRIIYVNGVSYGQQSTVNDNGFGLGGTYYIGKGYINGDPKGSVSGVRAYNRALTPTEVNTRYILSKP